MAIDSLLTTCHGGGIVQTRRGLSWAARRPLRRISLVVLVGGLAVACGGGIDATEAAKKTDATIGGSAGNGSADNASGGNAEASGNRPSGGATAAVGAPLNVPPIGGNNVANTLADATTQFTKACGGELCVTLVVSPKMDASQEDCAEFTHTDPTNGTSIQRGSVVKLIFDLPKNCDSSTGDRTERPVTTHGTSGPPTTTRLSPTTSR